MASLFGSPPQTQINQTPSQKPPGFNFARDFFNSLMGISQNPFPSYQGAIDPGMSPTMQDLMRRAQGYAQSGPPEILQGSMGTLGRMMQPSYANPVTRLFGGAPDYFGAGNNPTQTTYGGGPISGLPFNPGGQYGQQPPFSSNWWGPPAAPGSQQFAGNMLSGGGGPAQPGGQFGGGQMPMNFMDQMTGGPVVSEFDPWAGILGGPGMGSSGAGAGSAGGAGVYQGGPPPPLTSLPGFPPPAPPGSQQFAGAGYVSGQPLRPPAGYWTPERMAEATRNTMNSDIGFTKPAVRPLPPGGSMPISPRPFSPYVSGQLPGQPRVGLPPPGQNQRPGVRQVTGPPARQGGATTVSSSPVGDVLQTFAQRTMRGSGGANGRR